MDMMAYAMDAAVVGLCDVRGEARDFAKNNHRPEEIHARVEERPLPEEAVMIYAAGPPSQPWARGGKALGEDDPRAAIFDKSVRLIVTNRPLAFLLEESDKVPSYQQGK